MYVSKFISVIFLASFTLQVSSQTSCSTLGQNPATAFPVCGTTTFSQSIVPYCGGRRIPGPCTDFLTDINPFWYKFTCFTAGTLGFLITPNNLNDDYDWQIFDITGHNANDVYTDPSLFVACNWSGHTGLTGTKLVAGSLQNCGGDYPVFSAMPLLKAGHKYLLLISHFTVFTPSQNGYELSFGGGTANITDMVLPDISNAQTSCDATQIIIKLNKKMKCSSLADDGSDFDISPALSTIIGATGNGCNDGFDMDTVTLTLKNPLPPGNYTVNIKNGADGNTILDYCDRNITPGRNLPLTVIGLKPTPMDSLATVGCAPAVLRLVFKKNIRCSSVAADGSDFIVTGTAPVTVISAQGNCVNGTSDIINVILSGPIESQGNYQVKLVEGSDGNTIIDECGQETPAGATLNFATKDTVSATFNYTIFKGCRTDTISFISSANNGVNKWLWKLDDAGASTLTDPVAYFHKFGSKQIALSVSNGVCNDTVTNTVFLDNELKAAFETDNFLCPEDPATFVNISIGDTTDYWDFGNGNTSISRMPPPLHYPILSLEKIYRVSLIVKNSAGCFDTTFNNVKVLKSCYIAVPTAFTPNSDGLNDYLYPTNAYKADNLDFKVYNRAGQLVFHSTDRTKKWDGNIKGNPQDSGIYVWTLRYTNHDTGKKIFQKGTTALLR